MKSNEIKLIIFYHFSQTVCAWELLHQDWIADWIAADCFGQPALPQYAPDHAQQSAEGSAPKSVGRTHLLAELALRIGMQWRPVGWVKGGGVWLRVPAFEPLDCSRWPLFIAAHGTDHDLGSEEMPANGNILLRLLTFDVSGSPPSTPLLLPLCATFGLVYSTCQQHPVESVGQKYQPVLPQSVPHCSLLTGSLGENIACCINRNSILSWIKKIV